MKPSTILASLAASVFALSASAQLPVVGGSWYGEHFIKIFSCIDQIRLEIDPPHTLENAHFKAAVDAC